MAFLTRVDDQLEKSISLPILVKNWKYLNDQHFRHILIIYSNLHDKVNTNDYERKYVKSKLSVIDDAKANFILSRVFDRIKLTQHSIDFLHCENYIWRKYTELKIL